MIYKVGDRVVIKKDLKLGAHYPMIECKSYLSGFVGFCVNEIMLSMAGETATIRDVRKCDPYEFCYFLNECPYIWTDTMFENHEKKCISFKQLL